MDYLLSRHPIFKSGIQVAGYEIRSNASGDTSQEPSVAEAERSMYALLADAGLDEVVGPHPCFVTATRDALVGELWKGTPPGKVVVSYPNDFGPSDEIAQELLKLGNNGFKVAISGHLNPECLYLFGSRAHAIKVDVTRLPQEDLKNLVKDLRRFKAQLLAERVDTYDDLEFCKALGFDLYQGRFISRAASKEEKQIPVNRLTMLRVLAQLQDQELSMSELEKTIALDAALTYKLLTYVNSAAVAIPSTVNSVGHAMRLVGLQRLRTWASVLLISTVDDKPRELMTMALVRAKMCEQLAESVPNAQKESYFSTGLLSVVDALLDCSMEKALASLPLVDEVKAALIRHEGPMGNALSCALAYEQSDWESVQFQNLARATIQEIYLESITWAGQLAKGLVS